MKVFSMPNFHSSYITYDFHYIYVLNACIPFFIYSASTYKEEQNEKNHIKNHTNTTVITAAAITVNVMETSYFLQYVTMNTTS